MNLVILETVIEIQTHWAVTTNLDHARHCVSALGGVICVVCDQADLLENQYQGVVLLDALT